MFKKFFSDFLSANQYTVPSFFTYIIPLPLGISFPVNESVGIHITHYALISFASLSVESRIITSPFLQLPFILRLFTRPASGPSRILQRACTISPYTPVLPSISTTSAGVPLSIKNHLHFAASCSFFVNSENSFLVSPSSSTAIAAVPTSTPTYCPSPF